MSATYSNRVPISLNGASAEAVVSAGSDIPNSWMSFDYFQRIGFGQPNIVKVPGVEKVNDHFGNKYTVLGVPDRMLQLNIGDCPMPFEVRPFIIQFERYNYMNDFQLTTFNICEWRIISHFFGNHRITIGIANRHSIEFVHKGPNEPFSVATLTLGPGFDNNQWLSWLSKNQEQTK